MLIIMAKRSVGDVEKERMTFIRTYFSFTDVRYDNACKAQLLQHTTEKKQKEVKNILKTIRKLNFSFLLTKQEKALVQHL